jgi:hypothetical protein
LGYRPVSLGIKDFKSVLYWSEIKDYIAYDLFAVATVTAGDIRTYGGEIPTAIAAKPLECRFGLFFVHAG